MFVSYAILKPHKAVFPTAEDLSITALLNDDFLSFEVEYIIIILTWINYYHSHSMIPLSFVAFTSSSVKCHKSKHKSQKGQTNNFYLLKIIKFRSMLE